MSDMEMFRRTCNTVDSFLIKQHISNFSNHVDNTPYNCRKSCVKAISNLETTLAFICNWLSYNGFQANPPKRHLFISLFFQKKSLWALPTLM